MLYGVFPTPDDNCNNESSTDPQCSTDDTDIASAIDDAVANGANVISMSLGGGVCTSAGVDPDPVEGNAVANAIAHNVIVVAASGNAGGQGVDAPACDANVIAAGASGYEDGQANGTNAGATTGTEYVTSYTQFGSVSVADSATSWGIVAPGGIPQTPMIRQRRRRPTIYTGSRTSGRRRRSIQILPAHAPASTISPGPELPHPHCRHVNGDPAHRRRSGTDPLGEFNVCVADEDVPAIVYDRRQHQRPTSRLRASQRLSRNGNGAERPKPADVTGSRIVASVTSVATAATTAAASSAG